MITQEQIANAVCEIYKEAAIILPTDVKMLMMLKKAILLS